MSIERFFNASPGGKDSDPEQETGRLEREDEVILEQLAREVFPHVSIDEAALRKAVSRYFILSRQHEQRAMGELREFFQGEQSETALDAAHELGMVGGLDAMHLVVRTIREIQEKSTHGPGPLEGHRAA